MKNQKWVGMGLLLLASLCLSGFKKQAKTKNHADSAKTIAMEESERQKPLDLSVPLNAMKFAAPVDTVTLLAPTVDLAKKNKKSRPVELQGSVIMSVEQEAEKARSADGAGIMINLRN